MVLTLTLAVSPAAAAFGLNGLKFEIAVPGGSGGIDAGSHPFALETNFAVNTEPNPDPARVEEADEIPQGALRTLEVSLPPGMVGNPTAVPRCPTATFLEHNGGVSKCPADSMVGSTISTVEQPGNGYSAPVYCPRLPERWRRSGSGR
jgi:hypothetical protein